jgi:hypothetical protein
MNLEGRFKALMRDGNLTVADLARWFQRPDPTVRGWARGVAVGGAPADKKEISDALHKLEELLRKRKGLPVPRLSPSVRIEYLKRIAATHQN